MSAEVQAKIQSGEKIHAFLLPWDVKISMRGGFWRKASYRLD